VSDTYDVYGCQLSDREVKELSPENLVVVVNKETIFMEKNFVGKLLVDTPAVEVRLLNFRVGQQTPYEMAEYDLSLFVTEGTGNLALGYEDIELTKSTVVVVPKGMLWGIKNSGNGNMTILQNINKNPCLC